MSRVKFCPKCGAIAEWDSYFGGTRCTRCDFVEKPKPSNGDRIRAMSDFELAEMLDLISGQVIGTEVDDWIAWVKKEADNG